MNGVAGHQKDKPSAESDAAESAAAPAPSGAEPAGAGAPAPEAAASAPSDPPELATAATLQQCAPDHPSRASSRSLCLSPSCTARPAVDGEGFWSVPRRVCSHAALTCAHLR